MYAGNVAGFSAPATLRISPKNLIYEAVFYELRGT